VPNYGMMVEHIDKFRSLDSIIIVIIIESTKHLTKDRYNHTLWKYPNSVESEAISHGRKRRRRRRKGKSARW
jgi:hypothetical protein